jgi:hypothetical protein
MVFDPKWDTSELKHRRQCGMKACHVATWDVMDPNDGGKELEKGRHRFLMTARVELLLWLALCGPVPADGGIPARELVPGGRIARYEILPPVQLVLETIAGQCCVCSIVNGRLRVTESYDLVHVLKDVRVRLNIGG